MCLVAILFAVSLPSARADEWTKTDTVLELAVATSLGMDYIQTRNIMRDGREANPLLDRCSNTPEMCQGWVSPEFYFFGLALAHLTITRLTPRPWRTLIQGVTLGIQAKTVMQNYRIGYGFAF